MADEGLSRYYCRYDIKSSKNRVTSANLLMIPVEADFRQENFSRNQISGAISAGPEGSSQSTENMIRNHALKTLLLEKGLMSVTSKDFDTVVSYEGVIKTPLNILKQSYNNEEKKYYYKAELEFAAIAFPDKWETLHFKARVKHLFSDFLDFFK